MDGIKNVEQVEASRPWRHRVRDRAHLIEILSARSDGRETIGASLSLEEADLRGLVLPALRLRHLDARGSAFDEADLAGSTFHLCHLDGAAFDGAVLVGTLFRGSWTSSFPTMYHSALGTTFADATFYDVADGQAAQMTNMCFDPLDAERPSSFVNANLRLARWSHISARGARAMNVDFSCARLDRVAFAGADLRGANFSDAAVRADFRNADLRGARFQGADLAGSLFQGALLDGADFTSARSGTAA